MATNEFDFAEFLGDLDGGVLVEKVAAALQQAALGVVTYGDKGRSGEVTLKFKMKRIGESNQVVLGHALSYKRPTMRGSASEDDATETPMHVGRGGKLSLMPDTQTDFGFEKDREKPAH